MEDLTKLVKDYAEFQSTNPLVGDPSIYKDKVAFIEKQIANCFAQSFYKIKTVTKTVPIYFSPEAKPANLTLTRSILAENSPYFMTGVKYNYKPSSKWSFSGLLTNGWQRINKPNNKALPSLGTQVVYKPTETATLTWSTFIGDEPIGTDLRTRYFSNLYYDFQWKTKVRTIAGFDFGMQRKLDESGFNQWLSPVFITQYSINSKWQTAFRAEYYQDNKNTIITTNDEFKPLGFSLNLDYLPNSKVKFRTEARYFDSKKEVFVKGSDFANSNFFVTTSLSFEF